LDAALRAVSPAAAPDKELQEVFERVETERAETIPAWEIINPPKSGNITVTATIAKHG